MKIMNFRWNNKCKWIQVLWAFWWHITTTPTNTFTPVQRPMLMLPKHCLVCLHYATNRPSASKIEHISILFKSRRATSDSWKSIAANQTVGFFIGTFFADVNYLSVVYFNGFHLLLCANHMLLEFSAWKSAKSIISRIVWLILSWNFHELVTRTKILNNLPNNAMLNCNYIKYSLSSLFFMVTESMPISRTHWIFIHS